MAEVLTTLMAKLGEMQTTPTAKVLIEKSGTLTEIASLELKGYEYTGGGDPDSIPAIILHSA